MSQMFKNDINKPIQSLDPTKISLVEAIIFASRGVSKTTLAELTKIPEDELDEILKYLREKYDSEEHGIELKQIEDYYRFYTKPSALLSAVRKKCHAHPTATCQAPHPISINAIPICVTTSLRIFVAQATCFPSLATAVIPLLPPVSPERQLDTG